METAYIMQLIVAYSLQMGIDPNISLAVVQVESKFNSKAVGSLGEVGLFQVRPEYSIYTKQELFNPKNNIREGLRILNEARLDCKHKKENTWLVCYNVGRHRGKSIKYPKLFPYYVKVQAAREQRQVAQQTEAGQ